MAAGSLLVTEAGGLIGNFTGESDFLYQREVVAGNPKIYGQLVQILAPYTRVIKERDAEAAPAVVQQGAEPAQALAQAVTGPAPAAAPVPARKAPLRIRKPDSSNNNNNSNKNGDDAAM